MQFNTFSFKEEKKMEEENYLIPMFYVFSNRNSLL